MNDEWQTVQGSLNATRQQFNVESYWSTKQESQELIYVRGSALEKAIVSYIQGDKPTAEDIVARATIFEKYLLGEKASV